MHLAISNIAWPTDQDEIVARLLRDEGVEGIEIAPTKWWPNPLMATKQEIQDRRGFWEDRGFSIVAAQSLLFGRGELQLFGDAKSQDQLRNYLKVIIDLCSSLGAGPLVFGSPKNRKRGDVSVEKANRLASLFFASLADYAHERGTCVSLEANPPYYGADFMTTVAEVMDVVHAVDHPGVRLQIDTACMDYVNDLPSSLLKLGESPIAHFHVSEPNLAEIGTGNVDHDAFADVIEAIGYKKWISIEMRELPSFEIDVLRRAIRTTQMHYFKA
ncbi:sugar phosphate isomerase/epimerase [bacterium]|nr:sugar phosphate isomerase/epimerase [bacterium]